MDYATRSMDYVQKLHNLWIICSICVGHVPFCRLARDLLIDKLCNAFYTSHKLTNRTEHLINQSFLKYMYIEHSTVLVDEVSNIFSLYVYTID